MRHYLIGFIVTLFIAVSCPQATLADERENAESAAAQAAYHQSHYVEALALYSKLHVQNPNVPIYVWNLARCHQALRHPDEAIAYFNKFIGLPDVTEADRQEARGYISEMEKLKAAAPVGAPPAPGIATVQPGAAGAAATSQPTMVSGAQSDGGGALRVAGLVTAGVGVAALVAGTLFGAQAKSAANELNDKAPGGVYDSTLQAIDDRGRGAQTKEWIFLGVGGAALIAGGILYLVGHSQGTESGSARTVASVAVVPTILPHDVGAALSVRF